MRYLICGGLSFMLGCGGSAFSTADPPETDDAASLAPDSGEAGKADAAQEDASPDAALTEASSDATPTQQDAGDGAAACVVCVALPDANSECAGLMSNTTLTANAPCEILETDPQCVAEGLSNCQQIRCQGMVQSCQ